MNVAAKACVVLLSGGLDSATVLAHAKADGLSCHALSIDYGQRHRSELNAARRVALAAGVLEHKIVQIDLSSIGGSALTDPDIHVPLSDTAAEPDDDIPVTYVPARNSVFLSVALGYAETLGAADIFIGANAVDYSGYPDCRPEFIAAFEALANVATKAAVGGQAMSIKAPLIDLTKAQIISLGSSLGVDYGLTVSCYQADDDSAACGRCESCHIRRAGFASAGVIDPTRYQAAD